MRKKTVMVIGIIMWITVLSGCQTQLREVDGISEIGNVSMDSGIDAAYSEESHIESEYESVPLKQRIVMDGGSKFTQGGYCY